MPNRHNAEPPSNARVRRQAHLERQGLVRERKRLRRQRAEIHAAMRQAVNLTLLAGHGHDEVRPYRALDTKDHTGWLYVDARGETYSETSRDKARAAVKRLNEADPVTRDGVMLSLGFERTRPNASSRMIDHPRIEGQRIRVYDVDPTPVEKKFVRVGS